jgi:hypothetical protein
VVFSKVVGALTQDYLNCFRIPDFVPVVLIVGTAVRHRKEAYR